VPVIVVNAVDGDGEVAAFSSYGDARAVAAAGLDVLSTTPRGPTTTFPEGTPGYATLSGTSMATPSVAGSPDPAAQPVDPPAVRARAADRPAQGGPGLLPVVLAGAAGAGALLVGRQLLRRRR